MADLTAEEVNALEDTARALDHRRYGAKVEVKARGDDGSKAELFVASLPRLFDRLRALEAAGSGEDGARAADLQRSADMPPDLVAVSRVGFDSLLTAVAYMAGSFDADPDRPSSTGRPPVDLVIDTAAAYFIGYNVDHAELPPGWVDSPDGPIRKDPVSPVSQPSRHPALPFDLSGDPASGEG